MDPNLAIADGAGSGANSDVRPRQPNLLITEGSFDPNHLQTDFGTGPRFFRAQADSMLSGHLDVDPSVIKIESWRVDGKSYGYFGVFPSVLRMPFVLALGPDNDGSCSRNIHLPAHPCVYQEAIARSVAGACVFANMFWRWGRIRSTWALGVSVVALVAAANARPTVFPVGIVIAVGMCIVVLRRRELSCGLAATFTTLVIAPIVTAVAVFWAKFGLNEPFTNLPPLVDGAMITENLLSATPIMPVPVILMPFTFLCLLTRKLMTSVEQSAEFPLFLAFAAIVIVTLSQPSTAARYVADLYPLMVAALAFSPVFLARLASVDRVIWRVITISAFLVTGLSVVILDQLLPQIGYRVRCRVAMGL